MKDLGPISYFLGIEVHHTSSGLFLSQAKYIMDLLTRAGMTGAKPVSSPAASNAKLSHALGDPLTNPTEYHSIVGGLQYLTLTRPDITFVVNQICQYMHAPTTSHLVAVKHILRFLKGIITFGLHFWPGPLHLIAYCDADWAGNLIIEYLQVVIVFILGPILFRGPQRNRLLWPTL